MGALNNGVSRGLGLLIILVFSSLILNNPSSAQTIPKPAIPDFSLKFVDSSYDVPTTHTIDPYTGQDISHQGYHVSKTNLVMIIQNQPLVYQYNGSFLYNIRVKGGFAENWTQLFLNDEIPTANLSSTQTIVTIGTLNENGLTLTGSSTTIPYGGVEDFQVEAMIGGFFKAGFGHTEFSGELSGWSSTQTITISDGVVVTAQPTPYHTSTPTSLATESPNATPIHPSTEDDILFGLGVWQLATVVLMVVVVLLVFVLFYLRRRSVGSSVK